MADSLCDFDEAAALLERLIEERATHLAEGSCHAQDTCIGAAGIAALGATLRVRPDVILPLILTGVAEVARARKAFAEGRLSLVAQKGLTADAVKALEMSEMAAEEERDTLIGRIDDLERRLAAAESELTMFEDATDVLGPVHPVVTP